MKACFQVFQGYIENWHTKESTNLQERPGSGAARNTECRAHQKPGILPLYSSDGQSAIRAHSHRPIAVPREHQDLGAFLAPEHRGGRVTLCCTLQPCNAVEAHCEVYRLLGKQRRRCSHIIVISVSEQKQIIGNERNIHYNKTEQKKWQVTVSSFWLMSLLIQAYNFAFQCVLFQLEVKFLVIITY